MHVQRSAMLFGRTSLTGSTYPGRNRIPVGSGQEVQFDRKHTSGPGQNSNRGWRKSEGIPRDLTTDDQQQSNNDIVQVVRNIFFQCAQSNPHRHHPTLFGTPSHSHLFFCKGK